MNARTTAAVVGAALLAAWPAISAAQERKPLPPPAPAPAPGGMERLPSFPQWLQAYALAGKPRMLFYTDLITTNRGDVKLLNDAAAVTRLGGRIEQWFRSPEVVLLNPGAVAITTDEQRRALRDNDEFAAATLIGRQAQADVVVFIRLIEQSGRRDGVSYTGTYVMADLRQGTSIDRHSWDMTADPNTGEFDATRMALYAQALADRITNAFVLQFPPAVTAPVVTPAPAPAPAPSPVVVPDQGPGVAPGSTIAPGATPAAVPSPAPAASAPAAPMPTLAPRRFTLRLSGEYEDRLVLGFRDAIRNLAWMQPGSLVERGFSTADGARTLTFELMYAGTPLDLQNDLAAIAAERLEQDTSVLEAREGLVVVQLRPATLSARERSLIAGRETYASAAARQQFADAYARAGRPKLAVMVNPVVERDNHSTAATTAIPAPGSDASTQVIVAPRIVVGNSLELGTSTGAGGLADSSWVRDELARRERELRESRAIDTRTMEDNVYQRFLKLGTDMRDLAPVQSSLAGDQYLPGRVVPEQDLAANLAARAGADIIISGAGRVVRFTPDGYPSRLRYTFRAIRASDSAVIAADSVETEVDYTKPQWSRALERVADEAAAQMAVQLMDRWNAGR